MTNFESSVEFLKAFYKSNFQENYINSYILHDFKKNNKQANNESLKGHGKVDVLISLDNDSEYVIETKNYYSKQDLEFVYKQVLHRIHHRFPCASIVLLVNGLQKDKFKKILEDINKWVNLKNGKKQNQKINSNDNFFLVKIPNPKTGYDVLLNIGCYHLEFNINHAKKNIDINNSKYDEIENKSTNFIESLNKINNLNSDKIEECINKLKEDFIGIIHSCHEYNEYYLKPKKNNN